MNEKPLPKILAKYLTKISTEYLGAIKKHPVFAKFWMKGSWTNSYVHEWMLDTQKGNDDAEKMDKQNVFSIFQEEDLEVLDAIKHGDTKTQEQNLFKAL